MKISKETYDSVMEDACAIIKALDLDLRAADKGSSGIKPMYLILALISRDRAYDDTHPMFQQGVWTRILPYDGRDYCFFYEGECNDDHVATMLRSIQKKLLAGG